MDDKEIVASIRKTSGIAAGRGPSDARILQAVKEYVEKFQYWYVRILEEAVPQYRKLIILRTNPFIRPVELHGASAAETAERLVGDWSNRNFVTAGGWALEAMALALCEDCQKASATGIDISRKDEDGSMHLYVLKSGPVTRNSDILESLKKNQSKAETLLRQSKGKAQVTAHYAIAAGNPTSTFADHVNRPSSAEFWSHMTKLPEEEAIRLALAVARQAGRLLEKDVSAHISALETLVRTYIDDGKGQVDWAVIERRTLAPPESWKQEDAARHEKALAALAATGYKLPGKPPKAKAVLPLDPPSRKSAKKAANGD